MSDTIFNHNRAKIEECEPHTWWALELWLADCTRQGKSIKIVEAYRSQERQNALYAQGRTTTGKIVTWTKTSVHTKRLAVDVMPTMAKADRQFFADIAALAEKYGIYRPKELVSLGDLGHFQIDKVPPKPIAPPLSRRIDQLQKALQRTKNSVRRNALERRIAGLRALPPPPS